MRVAGRPSKCLIALKWGVVLLAYELTWGNLVSFFN